MFSQLNAGIYTIKVTDENGCISSDIIGILSPDAVTIDTIIVDYASCSVACSGSIIVQSSTAIVYTLGGFTNSSGVFYDICSGDYILTASDTNGCTVNQSISVISSGTRPTAGFDVYPKQLTSSNTAIHSINMSSNASSFHWTISNSLTSYLFSSDNTNFSSVLPSDTGTYRICLIAFNPQGCSDTVCQTVSVSQDIILYVPNTFTPDDNEHNQTMNVYILGGDPDAFALTIYNRWGEIIYESNDYLIGWDGYYATQKVPSGVYTWKISVKGSNSEHREIYTGHINVVY